MSSASPGCHAHATRIHRKPQFPFNRGWGSDMVIASGCCVKHHQVLVVKIDGGGGRGEYCGEISSSPATSQNPKKTVHVFFFFLKWGNICN